LWNSLGSLDACRQPHGASPGCAGTHLSSSLSATLTCSGPLSITEVQQHLWNAHCLLLTQSLSILNWAWLWRVGCSVFSSQNLANPSCTHTQLKASCPSVSEYASFKWFSSQPVSTCLAALCSPSGLSSPFTCWEPDFI
jgi:hypothetical protein